MNFFKKISPKFAIFLIIVCLSFTLTCCSSAPPIRTEEVEEKTEIPKLEYDKALIEFWGTYGSFLEKDEKEQAFHQKYNENVDKILSIDDDTAGLSTIWEKEKLGKLSQEALNIIEEQREILDKIRENLYDKSNIISGLHGKATKLIGSYKESLAQEIADNLRETNNLETEFLRLRETLNEHGYSYFKNLLFVSQGKMTLEESNKRAEDGVDDVKKISERFGELKNAMSVLEGKTSDLVAKLLSP